MYVLIKMLRCACEIRGQRLLSMCECGLKRGRQMLRHLENLNDALRHKQ